MNHQMMNCLARLVLVAIVMIAVAACGTTGAEPTAEPTIEAGPIAVEESEDEQPAEMVWAALDSAINHIVSQYGERAFPAPAK